MELILVNTPALVVPCGPTGNTMIKLKGVEGVSTPVSAVVTPVVDPTMSIDGFNVCTSVSLAVTYYPSGSTSTSVDNVVINGTSVCSTINNTSMVLKGDKGIGSTSGIQAEVISCGQTSTSVD